MRRHIQHLDQYVPRKRGKAVITDCPLPDRDRPHLYSCQSCIWYGGKFNSVEVDCKYEQSKNT